MKTILFRLIKIINMKKVLMLIGVASFSVMSCSDDEQPYVEPKLEGKWNMIKAEYMSNGELKTLDLKPGSCDYDYYDFRTDGYRDKVYHNENDNCATENLFGSWSYDEATKQITMIDVADDFKVVMEVISLTTKDLKVVVISENDRVAPEGKEYYIYLKR